MTVRLRTFTVVVVLMVLFSRPEAGSRSYVGHHAIPFLLQDTDQPCGKLLLLKDSYGNTFSQFACEDFEEVHVIDLRFFRGDIRDYIQAKGITDVLVLYGIQNFASDVALPSLA